MNAKPYPKYKASGVEWLGDVPGHWEVKRLRRVLATSLQYGANEAAELDDPELPRYVRITDVHENGSLRDETFRSLPTEIAKPYLLKDGDLLFARSGATAGKTFLYNESWGVCAYAGYLIRARLEKTKAVPAFVKYFTASSSYWQWLSSIYIQATIQNVSAEKYSDLKLPLPPLPEQTAIADFLDDRTAKLDALLEKKRALIGKLKEKRCALISRTVTQGLPPEAAAKAGLRPNPKLKPSGIPWLGDIPEHWEAMTVRRKARRIQTGGTPPTSEERYYEDGSVPWYGPSSFGDEIAVSQPVKFLNSSAVSDRAARVFKGGATMIVTIGATLGKIASLEEAGSCNQQITVIEFDERKVYPQFGTFQLKRLELSLRAIAPSATLPILDQGEIGDIPFAMPPIAEQKAIVDFLHAELSKIDRMIQIVETAIEKLTEYRTALITAAVTGKIDVRKLR